MGTGSLRYLIVPGVLVLLTVPSLRAQQVISLPSVPSPPSPVAANGVPPAQAPGGVLPAPAPGSVPPAPIPGIESLPQVNPQPMGQAPAGNLATEVQENNQSCWYQGISFSGDYLLLRPRRNADDFAIVSPNITQTPGGTVESVNWNTDSGFRLGAAYALPGQDWSIGVTYTYDHSHADTSAAAPDGGTLYATLTRGGSYDQVSTAVASSSFNYNVIDLDLSHKIKISPTFDLTIFGGGRFAWINQELAATYNGGPDKAVNDTVTSPVFFNGAGLTVGCEGQWNCWRGLGIYARVRGALLSGQFRDFLTETTDNNNVAIVNINEKYEQIVPVVEMGMGINYTGDHWCLGLGYELSNWFNMVNSVYFPDSSNIGQVGRRTSDLSLEGLAVRLSFVF